MNNTSIRDKIIGWLVDEDHEVKSEPVPPGAPLEWVLSVTAKVPPVIAKVVVQQPSTKKDRIIMTLGVMVSSEHRELLARLKPEKRMRVVAEVLKTVYNLCPDCVVVVQPSYIDPQNIIVTRILYHEELSRSAVAGGVRVLVNVLAMISTVLNAELGVVAGHTRKDEGFPTSFM